MGKKVECVVHFLRLLAVWWPDTQSARDNYLLACNFAKYSPILIFFTGRLSNKPFLIWLLTTPAHFKYVATLPGNASLITCFLTLLFHKPVRHIQKCGGIFNNRFTANLLENQAVKEL